MSDRSLVVRIIGDSSSLERSFARSSSATKKFDRDFSHATRGIAAGSGVFRAAGRSLAFASGGFLAFASGAQFLRKSVDAAKEAQVANAQLATQLKNSGKSFDAYRGQIDKTIFRLSALAGIEDDELKAGLTTILRTVPDVGKALRDLGTAADLARARHISLAQAAVIIAKTEAGNTTLLRRQGFQIAKNATAEQALAKVRQVVAGQAAAGTTQQERFGAVLHQTEEIIGQGILPTLNKYLESGSRWLEQMNESGKLQKDVARGAEGFAAAVSTLAAALKTVDKITGGFKNTLELLAAVKLSSVVLGWASALGVFSTQAKTAEARSLALRGTLAKLGAIGVITIGVEILLNKKTIDNKVSNFLDKNGLGFLGGNDQLKNVNLGNIDKQIAAAKTFDDSFAVKALTKYKQFLESQDAKAAAKLSAVQGAGPHGAALLVQKIREAQVAQTKPKPSTFKVPTGSPIAGLSAGLGASSSADQAALDAVQRRQAAAQAAQDRRAKALAALTAKQFRQLGLDTTGNEVTPGVGALKRRLGQLTANVNASNLNTPKLQSELKRFRKVLSEGIVPRDVRSKIKEMMDQIADQLKNSTQKNATKFRHTNANALLAGLGLDAETTRILRQRLAQVGAGGTVPGGRSAAFSRAGASQVNLIVDGKKMASVVTGHQRRSTQRRSESRRGPYAGRH